MCMQTHTSVHRARCLLSRFFFTARVEVCHVDKEISQKSIALITCEQVAKAHVSRRARTSFPSNRCCPSAEPSTHPPIRTALIGPEVQASLLRTARALRPVAMAEKVLEGTNSKSFEEIACRPSAETAGR